MSDRTFKIQSPHMTGSDITAWQGSVNNQLNRWHADDLLKVDGDYGLATRSFTSKVLYGLGIAQEQMENGVTPELRTKVRNQDLTPTERERYNNREDWRASLHAQVSSPLRRVLADSWGWHPGVHDGIDLISEPDAVIYSITDGTVVRVSSSGWWGLGAHASGGHPVSDGDGIVIVRCTDSVGPFKPGINCCYGHAEKARVSVGQKVKAGQPIAHTGFANAWHIHFMINDNPPENGFYKGVGDRDPRPYTDYAQKNG